MNNKEKQPAPTTSTDSNKPAGGLAYWSIHHPIGVIMISLAVTVIGLFSFHRLSVDLLPHLIYPEVRVRILDPGVSAKIMQDRVTRQLEEQLAITEDAINVQSRTEEGESSVDLSFQYGKDIDIALRDASTRLDRAKRFLPDTIRPPIIYKRDPSQIPAVEYVVSAPLGDPVQLRDWVDYELSRWFVNLPGVAGVEVGGGSVREIQVLPDPVRLAGLGLSANDIVQSLEAGNVEATAGRVETGHREYSGRTDGRFTEVAQISQLPIKMPNGGTVRLGEIAEIIDGHEDERIRVRLNRQPGVKMSIQKQPNANTVEVVDVVNAQFEMLKNQGILKDDILIRPVSDQSIYIRNALGNATQAALGGAFLAMLVVYLFLGNLRRTLIVGTAIPLSVVVTFTLMGLFDLTLNIMTLGGLALGVGMVVDSTIVMLENIYRHQTLGKPGVLAGEQAAIEVNSAIVASTSTNLAAIIPFLFISGLVGLLFKELIFTITAAIFSAMIVALTLAPSLGARVPLSHNQGRFRQLIDGSMDRLQEAYGHFLTGLMRRGWFKLLFVAALLGLLAITAPILLSGKQVFLPDMDDGRIQISITADPGIPLDEMDLTVQKLEQLYQSQPEVETVFTIVGGRVFGRSQRETSNKSSLVVQLTPLNQRSVTSEKWVKNMQAAMENLQLAGFTVRMRTGTIRGVQVSQGADDITLRITGPRIEIMDEIGFDVARQLKQIKGLRNITHSSEELRQELVIEVDHDRIAALGLDVEGVAEAIHIALDGISTTEFLDNDRSHPIRVRLPKSAQASIQRLESVLVDSGGENGSPIYVSDIANLKLVSAPAEILRDNQRRIVEVTASVSSDAVLGQVVAEVAEQLKKIDKPDGYSIYDSGSSVALKEGQQLTILLLGLALFLVFVVMAVQYESLINPLIILLCVPFTVIGVSFGLMVLEMPISMPLWLGLIMLAGIVVNNAIVLIEYMEILRNEGHSLTEAIIEAGRVRLRPVLMTTLTTVIGLTPLALGLGEGSEMLRPLAVTIVFGLTFSMLVTLVFIPIIYSLFHGSLKKGK
ncbi:MAG: efflux RND transporter permease subunit [Magnetococcales bacterium]|nr:efflux RND transporter permease subunit [Magnetococcales bacterium]